MAWWKKPGYERLCSTYVINPKNFNFGTVSICRVRRSVAVNASTRLPASFRPARGPLHGPRSQVPRRELEAGKIVFDQFTGCRGCCSGSAGYKNIFGNKYGQHLADIQVKREQLREEAALRAQAAAEAGEEKDAGAAAPAGGAGADVVWDLDVNDEADEVPEGTEEGAEADEASAPSVKRRRK